MKELFEEITSQGLLKGLKVELLLQKTFRESFKELMQGAKPLPEKFRERRYSVMYHGVGLCDEYPAVMYPEDWESTGYDGMLEPGMCVCVEAYVGEVGGTCGVKLEDQVVITETGFENLTKYPFEERLLS